MELANNSKFGLDLTAEIEVLGYTYTGSRPREVVARVQLGDTDAALGGTGGTYSLTFYLNDVPIAPVSQISVEAGVTQTIMVSRPVPIEEDDVVSIRVVGVAGDTDVNTRATLRDQTPLQQEDLTGGGEVAVDHNYGGTNALAYETESGAGIAFATVKAYRKEDYDASRLGADFVVAQTRTRVGGVWERALMLDPADYVLVYYKQGHFGPDAKELTVS